MKKRKLTKLDRRSVSRAYALLTTLALNIVIIIFGMFFLGNFLDKQFGTSPIFLFVCLMLGIGASFRNLYVLSMKSLPDQKKRYEYKEEGSNKNNE